MIVLAVIPPLWRKVMDPRVVAHFDGDVRLANVQPGKLDKLMAKFPPPGTELETEKEDITRQVYATEVLVARCPGCEYTYEVASGDEAEGFAAGTAWKDIPDDWCCPDCGVREKVDFIPVQTASGVAAQKASTQKASTPKTSARRHRHARKLVDRERVEIVDSK